MCAGRWWDQNRDEALQKSYKHLQKLSSGPPTPSPTPPAPNPYPGPTTADTGNLLWLQPPSSNNTFGVATAPTSRTTTPIAAPMDAANGGTTTNNDFFQRMEALLIQLSVNINDTSNNNQRFDAIDKHLEKIDAIKKWLTMP